MIHRVTFRHRGGAGDGRAHGETSNGAIGLSRSSYYRQVRGMTDYQAHGRTAPSTQHIEVLREVALKRVEAGTVECEPMRWHGRNYYRMLLGAVG